MSLIENLGGAPHGLLFDMLRTQELDKLEVSSYLDVSSRSSRLAETWPRDPEFHLFPRLLPTKLSPTFPLSCQGSPSIIPTSLLLSCIFNRQLLNQKSSMLPAPQTSPKSVPKSMSRPFEGR